jgi:hypothetical protein
MAEEGRFDWLPRNSNDYSSAPCHNGWPARAATIRFLIDVTVTRGQPLPTVAKEDSEPSFATHAVRDRQPVPSNTSIPRSAPQPTTKRIYTRRVAAVADISAE